MDKVPIVFQPLLLRSSTKFRDLDKHSFTKDEIMWLCKEMQSTNLSWEYHRVSPVTISKRYHINLEGLKLWMANYNQDFNCFSQNEQCCQPLIDGISKRRISNLLNENEISSFELITIMDQELIQTKKRRSHKVQRKSNRIKAPH